MKSISRFKFALVRVLVLLGLVLHLPQAEAERPAWALSVGSGSDAEMLQLSFISHQGFFRQEAGKNYIVSAHLETSLASMAGRKSNQDISFFVVGMTPILRIEQTATPLFFEAGIGANYFQQRKINDTKSLGTRFEFGDLIGFGYRFSGDSAVELGYRFIHYSNAGISTENPGLNLHQIRLKAAF